MIEKDDWRLKGNEDYLRGQRFKKIKFPDFWRQAYEERNAFYQEILKDAQNFVKEYGRGEEWLEGEKVQAFWHEHCYFCWDKFMTDKPAECFCSQDYKVWICKTCFEDFKEELNLLTLDE